MSRVKYWCMECRDRCLTWKCNKHGSDPVFHHSHKLRVPDYKNKVKFRKFILTVNIFFNMIRPEQEELLRVIAKELRIEGMNINGRQF